MPVQDSFPPRRVKNDGKSFTLCVFCGTYDDFHQLMSRYSCPSELGSSAGRSPQYERAAVELANVIASKSWSLVYGGGTLGLMGILAREVVTHCGPTSVQGIIPRALLMGGPPPPAERFGQTLVVTSMHTRKQLMATAADAFVALPGGLGTLEELLEMATWHQLGIHSRPVALFNVDGFFNGLLDCLHHAVQEGFLPAKQANIVREAPTAEEVARLVEFYYHENEISSGYTTLNWSNEEDEDCSRH